MFVKQFLPTHRPPFENVDLGLMDYLSMNEVGATFFLSDFDFLGIPTGKLNSSIQILRAQGYLELQESLVCEDCLKAVLDEDICDFCGGSVLGISETIQKTLTIKKPVMRSEDSKWPIDNRYFESSVIAVYSNGKEHSYRANIKDFELSIAASALINSLPPVYFKNADAVLHLLSSEHFRPKNRRSPRRYTYKIKIKEKKNMQSVTINGNSNKVSQSIQKDEQKTEIAISEIKHHLEELISRLDANDPEQLEMKEKIEEIKSLDSGSFLSKGKDITQMTYYLSSMSDLKIPAIIANIQHWLKDLF